MRTSSGGCISARWGNNGKRERVKRGVDYIGVGVGAILVDGDGRLFLSEKCAEIGLFGLEEIPGDLTTITRDCLAHHRRGQPAKQ